MTRDVDAECSKHQRHAVQAWTKCSDYQSVMTKLLLGAVAFVLGFAMMALVLPLQQQAAPLHLPSPTANMDESAVSIGATPSSNTTETLIIHTAPRTMFADVSELGAVPKVMWQTAKSHVAPLAAIEAVETWSIINPTWDHYVLDDAEIDAFVARWYNASVLAMFRSLPLGVMRADLFRYMVVHTHGGVYTDIDTECLRPVERWVDRSCSVAIALENDLHFCQWSFASAGAHPLMGRVVQLCLEGLLGRTIDMSSEHFVHEYTGPAVFTRAVIDHLNIEGFNYGSNLTHFLRDHSTWLKQKRGLCFLSAGELELSLTNKFASQEITFQRLGWESWTTKRDRLVRNASSAADVAHEI